MCVCKPGFCAIDGFTCEKPTDDQLDYYNLNFNNPTSSNLDRKSEKPTTTTTYWVNEHDAFETYKKAILPVPAVMIAAALFLFLHFLLGEQVKQWWGQSISDDDSSADGRWLVSQLLGTQLRSNLLWLVLASMASILIGLVYFCWYSRALMAGRSCKGQDRLILSDQKWWLGLSLVGASCIRTPRWARKMGWSQLSGYRACHEVNLRVSTPGVSARNMRFAHHDKLRLGESDICNILQLVMRTAGLDILILSSAEHNIYGSLFAILGGAVVYSLAVIMMRITSSNFLLSLNLRLAKAQVKDAIFVKVSPNNIYMGLGQSFSSKLVPIFAGQCLLLVTYSFSIHDDLYTTLCTGKWSWFMIFASIIVQFLMMTQLGKSFVLELEDWAILFLRKGWVKRDIEEEECPDTNADAPDITGSGDAYVRLRCLMSFAVNSVLWTFVLCTVPLVLIGSDDGMDFVKDCLAMAYITMLDDVDDDDTIQHLVPVDKEFTDDLMEKFMTRKAIKFGTVTTRQVLEVSQLDRQQLTFKAAKRHAAFLATCTGFSCKRCPDQTDTTELDEDKPETFYFWSLSSDINVPPFEESEAWFSCWKEERKSRPSFRESVLSWPLLSASRPAPP
jgi:hypothetical protein